MGGKADSNFFLLDTYFVFFFFFGFAGLRLAGGDGCVDVL
jgi:hypothetical protein